MSATDITPDKVRLIAEVSSNHNRDLDRCLRFVDVAAGIGCEAVKFQLFRIEELFAPEILSRSERHYRRKKWELPVSFLPELYERCQRKGIRFSCTPFYLKAVDELLPYVDFFKLASYELLWTDLLVACARTGKPVVLSTGMANMSEIRDAVRTLRNEGCRDLTLLHCVSGYPVPISECNLAAIETLRREFGCPVGWSDHSVSPGVLNRAVNRWGAELIEFHLDLEGEGREFETGHCWLPAQMVKAIDPGDPGLAEADGSGIKEPAPGELSERDWRADPHDGLRPLKRIRETFRG